MGFRELFAGKAGQGLVVAHLRSIEVDCGEVEAKDFDIVAKIGGIWREIEVKASFENGYFSTGGPCRGNEQKSFTESSAHAFAFCFLAYPYPIYFVKEAVSDTMSIKVFSRGERDRTFNEMLRRWGVPSPLDVGMFA